MMGIQGGSRAPPPLGHFEQSVASAIKYKDCNEKKSFRKKTLNALPNV